MVDVFEDGDYVVILAELPGMDEENVKVEASENVVRITAENSAKSYSEIVKIPVGTLSRAVKFTYRNNVLQARLEKTIHD
jgi:HSP20 family protein